MSGMTEEQKRKGEAFNAFLDWWWASEKVIDRETTITLSLLKPVAQTINRMLSECEGIQLRFDIVKYSEADRKKLFDMLKAAKTAYVEALVERQRKDLETLNGLDNCVDELARAYGVN